MIPNRRIVRNEREKVKRKTIIVNYDLNHSRYIAIQLVLKVEKPGDESTSSFV